MKKISILLLTAISPMLTYAEEAAVAVEEAPADSGFLAITFIIMAIAFIFMAVVFLVIRGTDQKNEILNSNLARVKEELRMKGYNPERALIDILHRESSLYGGPPEPIIINQQAPTLETVEVPAKADHSLVLKIADELIRIQKNLGGMDEGTRGLKQLNASVGRIANNFIANGYELVDMLDKPYKEGLNAAVSFVSSDELPTGRQMITRIIKPQVNYKGEMIQSAQIEVSVGE
ncbi:MAG: hypothetical protein GQ574_28995 [Crocinitomix sp.]|nr:hypothetical protein [Crocinitomix sp.]